MKIEQQVCSLELAQKLKTVGVKQESYFKYYKGTLHNPTQARMDDGVMYVEPVAAFTVAELGEMLPQKYVREGRWLYSLVCGKNDRNKKTEWFTRYECDGSYEQRMADTEADARAKMLIYLLEKGLTTA
jgi:hypothetical protein